MATIDYSSRLHEAMAGHGNPRRVLTPLRKQLLRDLHDVPLLTHLATVSHLSSDALQRELAPLVAAHLLSVHNGIYHPTFLVTNQAETERVTTHAARMAGRLAEYLLQHWDVMISASHALTVVQQTSFAHMAFFLVGDRLLDIGLLDALAGMGTLMPPAPARPSTDDPTARFYLWMIEGRADQLGKYGQRAIALRLPDWYLLTFGQYRINGHVNTSRAALEAAAEAAREDHPTLPPWELGGMLNISTFTQAESGYWTATTHQYAADLAAIYQAEELALRQLYASLHASSYAPHSFGEFFCWYDHVAYACAIDMLAEAGVLVIPDQRYAAAIWYEETQTKAF